MCVCVRTSRVSFERERYGAFLPARVRARRGEWSEGAGGVVGVVREGGGVSGCVFVH